MAALMKQWFLHIETCERFHLLPGGHAPGKAWQCGGMTITDWLFLTGREATWRSGDYSALGQSHIVNLPCEPNSGRTS